MALSMEKAGMSEVSQGQEKATYDKVFWRCVPLFFLCYMVSYLDRVNIGFAKLQMLATCISATTSTHWARACCSGATSCSRCRATSRCIAWARAGGLPESW
jgi:sugar phosphate permease